MGEQQAVLVSHCTAINQAVGALFGSEKDKPKSTLRATSPEGQVAEINKMLSF